MISEIPHKTTQQGRIYPAGALFMQVAEIIPPLALAELRVSLPQKPEAALSLGA